MSIFNLGGPTLRFGLKSLWRDWRSGELTLIVMALVVAVAAMSSVGFMADRVARALTENSVQMLGADLVVDTDTPLEADITSQADRYGLKVAQTVVFPSMVASASATQLASVKAVASPYPLYPGLTIKTADKAVAVDASSAPAQGQAWVDPQVLVALGLSLGQNLEVGTLKLKIAAVIDVEPDRGMRFVNVAPRVMINAADLQASGLLGLGSRVSYHLLVAGPSSSVRTFRTWLEPRLEPGQQLRTLDDARPEVRRSLTRAHQFLVLVALLAVFMAAVAIALAARRYHVRHRDGMAVMRCLGAQAKQVRMALTTEFLLLGVLAGSGGCLVGFLIHELMVRAVASLFQAPLPPASWWPGAQALVAGLVLFTGFALAPLAELGRTAPLRVLRQTAALPGMAGFWSYLFALAVFFALVWSITADARLAALVLGGFVSAGLVFAGLALALLWLLGRWQRPKQGLSVFRFAMAGLARRRRLALAQISALALGLMVLLSLTLLRTDLLQGWQNTIPPDAPDTFLINIQPDQRHAVEQALQADGIADVGLFPLVRGRLVAINDRDLDPDAYTGRARHLIDREFNLSYRPDLPPSNRVAAGRWLDPARSEVSLEEGVAQSLGLKVGDRITFDIAGTQATVRIAGFRAVKWDTFDVNFFALLSPSSLASFPASYITSFKRPSGQPALTRDLVQAFPNLTVFDVGALLGQVQRILDQVARAVELLFIFTVLAGGLVLAAAYAATRDERMHEVAILRTLGANAGHLRRALAAETWVIGALSGGLAALGAQLLAWLLALQVLNIDFHFSLWPWGVGILVGISVSMASGALALRGVLTTPPLLTLRNLS